MKLYDSGIYLVNGRDIVEEENMTQPVSREEAARNTMAYGILEAHNTSGNMQKLQIKFDKLTSHDITFVGIIQTARASGLEKFPIPYVLTNCHNSLCAVGGTINEDDHMFGLTCAKKYGGVYVPPHQAVIHQFAREMLAGGGKMILGSDSHTRYGALGTMAMGEGGGELVKQLLSQTYDINMPGVVAIYLKGEPRPGVGPQDVALAIIGKVFANGYVKNKVMEFVGPGVAGLSADFRIGIDVMTTETTCLSSIWQTDETIEEFYEIHGRKEDYKELKPGKVAYYDGCVEVDLSEIKPMIAMPFHPSNTYTIDELKANLYDILDDVEKKAQISLDGKVPYTLKDKVIDGQLYVDQGIIAGCAGGGFENICAAADILRGASIGADAFTLSVYPASTPIYMELARNGVLADLLETGAVVKTAFCGPCFGAGDTPANNAFSIRHTTRNFPNREGSKVQNGQISSVALMDARSIAATAAMVGSLPAGAVTAQAADDDITIGVSIWSSTDVLGSQSKKIIDKAADALGVNVMYVDQGHVSEQVTASVEQLCAAGCNGIVICNSADSEMTSAIQTCDANQVYLTQFYRIISEENSPEVYQTACNSQYYLGAVHEDEVTNGYTLVNLLLENGDRNIGLEAWTVGDATFQQRWKGYKQAVDEWNEANPDDQATITEPVYANTSSEEGAAAALSLYNSNPDMDALIVAGGGGDPLVGSIGALANEGLTGKIDVVSTDFLDDLGEQLESGGMFAESGGHFCDPLYAFLITYNAIKGNYVKDEGSFGYEIQFPYLYVSSSEDYENYKKYFVDDDPYTDEELVELAGYSFDDLNKAATSLSIEDVISRHSN